MKNRHYKLLMFIAMTLFIVSCSSTKQTKQQENYQYTEHNIKYLDIKEGAGPTPNIGNKVTINTKVATEDGTVLEDTFKSKTPISFVLYDITDERLQVIKGLAEGIMTMKQGGIRKLWITPEMGFGSRSQKTIPANSNLIITVQLLKIE